MKDQLQYLNKLRSISDVIELLEKMELFVTPEEIVERSAPLPPQDSGVYFLVNKETREIEYVGQSKNVFNRFSMEGKHSAFRCGRHEIFVILAWEDQLDLLESFYIHYLNPILNRAKPPMSLEQLDELVNPHKRPVKGTFG